MNVKKCAVCNIGIDEYNCKKDRDICKICYNIYRKKYNNKEKKRKTDDSVNKIDNVNNKINDLTLENHRLVNIGPSNVGKTYYMLKVLEK